MTEISVTFKAHAGYDAPWVVVKADSVSSLSETLKSLRDEDAFIAVKTMADEFLRAPLVTTEKAAPEAPPAMPPKGTEARLDKAQAAIENAMPGGVVIRQESPKCPKCGNTTTYRSGSNPKSGPWEAYFCDADRQHVEFLK